MEREPLYLVSACLAGVNCRYDGGNCRVRWVEDLVSRGRALALCPEVLGGLGVPREPCEIRTGEGGSRFALTRSGADYTDRFRAGACRTLEIVQAYGINSAVLKSRSPSCGLRLVYDGTFSGSLAVGMGITAYLLRRHGVRIFSEVDHDEFQTM
jgi:uncharacterized protein YbbK (DUF523 family)